jgi:hypothetical protein
MAHLRLLVDRVLVSAWKTPEHDDVQAITTDLASARTRLAKPLLYLSVIGPASIPKGGIRDELVNFYQALLANCESIHIVIEGTEFQQSIKRSVIANVLLVVPARGRVFIDNTLPGVISASPSTVRPELTRAAQQATDQRLFDFARAPS